MIVLGIDPGMKNGALALVSNGDSCETFSMPLIDDNNINGLKLYNLIKGLPHVDMVALEAVHANPKFGSKGSFTFGKAAGQILSVLQILKLPIELVNVMKWKHHYKLVGGKKTDKEKKEASIARALEIFPLKKSFKNDHHAEAALIGKYVHSSRLL